jgi:hypothetical protein
MAIKINADNSTGLEITSDTSTNIDLQSNDVTKMSIGTTIDIQGNELVLDADADTSIHASTDDQIDFKTGGTDRMVIDSAGKVGIGNTSPSYKLSLQDSGNFEIHLLKTSVSDAWVRNIGNMDIASASGGASGQNITFSNGSNYAGLTERMRIDGSGNVGIGTTSVQSALHVVDAGATPCIFDITGTTGDIVLLRNGGSTKGTISTNGSTVSYNTSSDYRLKENVDYTWDATTRLKQLKPARFNWIADDTNTLLDGFIAHEVSSIVPEAVNGTKDAKDDDDNPIYQGIDQSKLVPLLVKTIQELEARITALES